MEFFLAFLLTATCFVMGVVLDIKVPIAFAWLAALAVILGWILEELRDKINKRDSLRGLNGIGSGSGKTGK